MRTIEIVQKGHMCQCQAELVRLKEQTKRERQKMVHSRRYVKLLISSIEELWEELQERDINWEKSIGAVSDFIEKQFQIQKKKFMRFFHRALNYYNNIKVTNDEKQQKLATVKEERQEKIVIQSKLYLRQVKKSEVREASLRQSLKEEFTPSDILEKENSSKAAQRLEQSYKLAQSPSEITIQESLSAFNTTESSILRVLNSKAALPIKWSKRPNFTIDSATITKQSDGWQKLRTQKPIPKSGKHFFKFKVHTPCTLSFGLAVEEHKSGKFINDKLNGTISYISFDNGGGMVKHDGQVIANGQMVHISPETNLQMTIDFNKYELTWKNSRSEPLRITMVRKFPISPIYLFLHIKNKGAVVEVLDYSVNP